jgi:SnoaL-like protein
MEQPAMAESVRDFFTRYVQAVAALDFETLEPMFHPDFVGNYPQSGERFHGFSALKAQLEQYPGGLRGSALPAAQAKIFGAEERWAISPGYTVLPLAGPERYTTIARSKYPDGSLWWVVGIVELKDGKIYRADSYFAPDFEPPEWRRGFVEIVPRDE